MHTQQRFILKFISVSLLLSLSAFILLRAMFLQMHFNNLPLIQNLFLFSRLSNFNLETQNLVDPFNLFLNRTFETIFPSQAHCIAWITSWIHIMQLALTKLIYEFLNFLEVLKFKVVMLPLLGLSLSFHVYTARSGKFTFALHPFSLLPRLPSTSFLEIFSFPCHNPQVLSFIKLHQQSHNP